MAYVDDLTPTKVIPVPIIDAEKGRDLTYLAAFAAIGLLFSVLSYAVTPAALWPEGAVALAPETASDGLIVSQTAIPAGLQVTEYSAH
jgi:hypothetical protein